MFSIYDSCCHASFLTPFAFVISMSHVAWNTITFVQVFCITTFCWTKISTKISNTLRCRIWCGKFTPMPKALKTFFEFVRCLSIKIQNMQSVVKNVCNRNFSIGVALIIFRKLHSLVGSHEAHNYKIKNLKMQLRIRLAIDSTHG